MTNRIAPDYVVNTAIDTSLSQQVSRAYNAQTFHATVFFEGVDRNTGRLFSSSFMFSQDDPEFVQMLNDYAARKAGEQIAREWLPITDSQPADCMPVDVKDRRGKVTRVYRYGKSWYMNHGERKIINPDFVTFQIIKK